MSAKHTIELDDALKRLIDELAATNATSPAEILRVAVDEFASRQNGRGACAESESLWEVADQVRASVPDEEWDKLPPDLAKNFDHYHYGHPRED